MWERFKRVVRSFVGFFIELGEDPELILKQNIRDMQDQIPAMNENIAMVKANETLLQKECDRLVAQEKDLAAKIQASLKAGRRDIGLNYATTLEQVRKDLAISRGQLETATAAYEKAAKVKKAFMLEIERKSREAMHAIQAAKRAEWQKKVADAMDSFKVAGIDATHDEMVAKIERKAAESEARMQVAMTNVDAQGIEIEEEAQKLQANETLRQFEIEMGLVPTAEAVAEAPPSEKTIGPKEKEKEKAKEKAG